MMHGNNLNDKLHDKIITAVKAENGIRLNVLSDRLDKKVNTLKYRVLMMSAMGELEIRRGPGCFRIFIAPGQEIANHV